MIIHINLFHISLRLKYSRQHQSRLIFSITRIIGSSKKAPITQQNQQLPYPLYTQASEGLGHHVPRDVIILPAKIRSGFARAENIAQTLYIYARAISRSRWTIIARPRPRLQGGSPPPGYFPRVAPCARVRKSNPVYPASASLRALRSSECTRRCLYILFHILRRRVAAEREGYGIRPIPFSMMRALK